ncbi:aminotransferase-like domain-containing protein [Paraburkholderia tropica]|uniref:aminotransferase-like domain-containing protein n=1 Tax=Paraburkholderia tropica TaxID=92647 RepID=UPI002AB7B1B5|nr:PLP-dependent aminotransferase family protein [Paraburkholderia tropica]
MNARFANRMNYVKPSAIRELLQYGADPNIISFGGGYPDPSIFPVEQLNYVYQSSITKNGRTALQYTVSNGIPRLREQIAQRMTRDGVPCSAENILVLQGGQQGLDLVAKMLIDRGDVIVTEGPTFLGALIAFNPYEPKYVSVPMDENGMDMDELERVLERQSGIKFLYTVPDFQNPTGVTLSLERRKRLVELANRYDFIVLEDSPYREVRYEGEAIPPIKSFDTEGRVIYLGSFSKILAPGLRLGWVVGSESLVQQLGLLKLAADTQCSTLNMSAVSEYLDTYDIDQHIASIREVYRRKKNIMLEAIRQSFPKSVKFTEPSGGMFTWLTFPEGFDAAQFMRERAVPEAKVAFVPGATFFPTSNKPNHARLSYATQSNDSIVKGIGALGDLLTAML